MIATIRARLMPLVWESDFFALPSARLSLSDDAPVLTSEALAAYAMVQAKVAASDLATICRMFPTGRE